MNNLIYKEQLTLGYFDIISDIFFVERVSKLVKGIGIVYNDCGCDFEIDNKSDIHFAEIWILDDEQLISKDIFFKCLKQACVDYSIKYPHQKSKIDDILQKLE